MRGTSCLCGRLEFFNVSSARKAEMLVGKGREIKLVYSQPNARARKGSYVVDDIPNSGQPPSTSARGGASVRDGPHRKKHRQARHPFHFFLVTPHRTWQFSAESEWQKQQFIDAVKATVGAALGHNDSDTGT